MLGVEPVPGAAGVAGLVAARWERGAVGGWRVVGVTLPEAEAGAGEAELLEGLVAGDVVIGVGRAVERGAGSGPGGGGSDSGGAGPDPGGAGSVPGGAGSSGGAGRVLVHRGDRWTPVR